MVLRRALATVLAAVLVLTTTACGPGEPDGPDLSRFALSGQP